MGTPKTVGVFLCHLLETPAHLAFMQIYYQIPITRTDGQILTHEPNKPVQILMRHLMNEKRLSY